MPEAPMTQQERMLAFLGVLVAAGFSLLALLVVVRLPQLELRGKRNPAQARAAGSAADD